MKKLLILLAVSALFFACSSDKPSDKIKKDHLVGKWYLSQIKETSYWDGEREDYEEFYTKEDTWLHREFSADGTMAHTELSPPEEPQVFTAAWSINGNILTLEYDFGDKDVLTIESLTSTTMTLSEEGLINNELSIDTFTFVKMN